MMIFCLRLIPIPHPHSAVPPNTPKVNYKKPGFFDKFLESHQVMWTINNGLTSSHPFDSRPSKQRVIREKLTSVMNLSCSFFWYFSIVAIVEPRYQLLAGQKRTLSCSKHSNLPDWQPLGVDCINFGYYRIYSSCGSADCLCSAPNYCLFPDV